MIQIGSGGLENLITRGEGLGGASGLGGLGGPGGPGGTGGLSGLVGSGAVRGVAGSAGEGGFAEALQSAVRSVEGDQAKADDGLRALAAGQSTDLHGTMIALEEANISLRTMGSVRDKLVDGWQTLWNMQI